ncbi:conserved hypothetical protein [uncultured Paludibacter sp.]|uniref:Uncharacterized protein n=1 Tax=uncultured Paludibacter sp. TaxID=497635 RepID=A0A653AFC0_9BACT|nr:conserved hypothetical protein [uncultured Paludibacter sp.]
MGEKDTKEINLLDLLNIFVNWLVKVIKGFAKFIGSLFQLAVKYWVLFLAVLFLSVAVGLYLSRPSAKQYKAGSVALLYGSETSTAQEVCRQLQNSLATNKSFSLATKLGIPDSVAKNIIAIQNFSVIDYLKDGTPDAVDFKRKHSLTDTLNLVMKDRIYIQAITKNISQLPVFQEALLRYFNNNPMMNAQFESAKTDLQDKIKLCDKEINRLDSLAKVTYFKDTDKKISFENNRLVVGEQKKQLFYDDILRLQDIKSYTKSKLVDFKRPIEFPSGLVLNPIPVNSRLKYGVYSVILGALLGFLLVFLLDNSKKIIHYLKNEK